MKIMKYKIGLCLLLLFASFMTLKFTTSANGNTIKSLSLNEMKHITGGSWHCADKSCPPLECAWDWGLLSYQKKVSNGTTGRTCSGRWADCCSSKDEAECAIWYYNCNSGCTTCTSQQSIKVDTWCSSSGG